MLRVRGDEGDDVARMIRRKRKVSAGSAFLRLLS